MTLLRIIGNFLVMAGYPVLLYLHPALGAGIKTVGHVFLLTYFVKYKAWDMLFSLLFVTALDLGFLIKNLQRDERESNIA
ncbi:MAG: hypothetical protein MUD14_29925 [Hydrococcus sp. Prado102]|jgi:hypothetical protein|nr:hypothetical protein [Hydrococcus sp. Prado102]